MHSGVAALRSYRISNMRDRRPAEYIEHGITEEIDCVLASWHIPTIVLETVHFCSAILPSPTPCSCGWYSASAPMT